MPKLNDFLLKHKIRQQDFADRLNVDQTTVSRLTRNAMRPSLALAVAIERETGGEIAAASWVDVPKIEGAA